MGFLEKVKTPEQDKNFFFREEYLAAFKYSLYHFTRKNKEIYYPNFFFIEGEEGVGKSWLINQFSLFCKDRNIAPECLDVYLDTRKVILSDVLGIINFMVQIRNLLVEKEPFLEQAFVKFDQSYKAFLEGNLTDDGDIIPTKEEEKKEINKAKSTMQAMDAKSRLASMRAKTPAGTASANPAQPLQQQGASLNLNPDSLHNKLFPQKKQAGHTATKAASGYAPFVPLGAEELPRMRDGEPDIKAIAKSLSSAVESLKKSNIKAVDYKAILIRKFLYAFEIICSNRRVVLIIDNFEKIQPIFNFVFNGFLKNIQNEFMLVAASQMDMEKDLKQRYGASLLYIYLQNFSYLEIEEYLKKYNVISEPGVIDGIIELTKGAPAGIALIAGAFQSFKSDVFRIMKFLDPPGEDYKNLRYVNVITLDHLPQNDKRSIILLALIREFDPELVASITGVFNANHLLQTLAEKYNFIEKTGMPELIQRFTRTYAKHEMPSLYEEIHRLAFDFYSNKIALEPKNKNHIINSIYYYFRVNEDRAYTYLLQVISFFITSDINFCEELISEISSSGVSKEMRNRLGVLRESIPYFLLKDYKKTLPLLEAISELQRENTMEILDGF